MEKYNNFNKKIYYKNYHNGDEWWKEYNDERLLIHYKGNDEEYTKEYEIMKMNLNYLKKTIIL